MSPSLSPAPVANLNMVPPTWFRPGDWAAGRAEPHPRLRTTMVSTHQVVTERQTDRFRYAHAWHLFPTEQPPSRTRQPRSSRSLDSARYRSSLALALACSCMPVLVHACARQPPCECQLPCFRRSTRFRHSYRSRFRSPPPRLSNSLWLSDPTRLLPSSILSNAIALLHCRRSSTERLPTASRY